MDYAVVGKMIKHLRKEQRITQGDLCKGIMDRSNLSRIENGEQAVPKDKMDLLFNRLGHAARRFFTYMLTDEAFTAYELRTEFGNAQAAFDEGAMQRVIAEMERRPDFGKGLNKQFLLKSKASMSLRREPPDYAAAQALLYESIEITIPGFDPLAVDAYLLGDNDNGIIVQIAQVLFEIGEREKAITVLERLAGNVRRRIIGSTDKARFLTFVCCYLSKYYGITEQYDKVLAICDEAIDMGVKHQIHNDLPRLKYDMACALRQLGGDGEEIKDLLYQAYYGSRVHGDDFIAGIVKGFALSRFGIDFAAGAGGRR
jgi:transcriptional regulator with XRE-family HTH domain